jgi:hypothetical protein
MPNKYLANVLNFWKKKIQKMYTIKVVWFHKNINNIEIFNAMKLGLGIQGTQIKPKVVTIHITKLN